MSTQPSFSRDIESSPLYNHDLAPVPAERRSWTTYNYAALWVSMSVNILTYILAANLVRGGMNWKQAVATIFLGNTIVLAFPGEEKQNMLLRGTLNGEVIDFVLTLPPKEDGPPYTGKRKP